jgi:hypothetical protein
VVIGAVPRECLDRRSKIVSLTTLDNAEVAKGDLGKT